MPRHNHTLNFIECNLSLVVCGGYSEELKKPINDMFSFSL